MNDRTEVRPVEERPSLVYAEHEGQELLADAYLPRDRADAPAIVLLHGGAWTKGSRTSYHSWGRFLAGRGYAALAVDYLLAKKGAPSYPRCLWDVKAALQFLRRHAAELRVDPERIAVMGGSAGAYLAAMAVLTRSQAEFANPYSDGSDGSADVTVAICLAGTFDLVKRWEQDQLQRPSGANSAETFLGGTPMSARRTYFEASPTFHASESNARSTTWLLSWGTQDDVTRPADQSLRFSVDLKRAGATVRHAPVVGAPHFWYFEGEVDDGPFQPFFADRLLTFLKVWCQW